MHLIRLLALTFCFIGLAIAEQSPVFLWGTVSEPKSSLQIVSTKDFAALVTPLLKNKALVVYMENDLSSKDFSCTNDDGNSCYARLQGMSNKTYYAAVENPIKALRTIGREHYYNSVDDNGKISKNLKTDAGKITFVKFDDKRTPDRVQSLKLHDSIIESVTSKLGENVFFMYVSSPSTSSLQRQRREVPQDNAQGYVFHKDNLLLYYRSLSIVEGNNAPILLDIQNLDVKSDNAAAMSVTLTLTNGSPLTFDITFAGGYFFMKNVMYKNVKLLSSDVYAPTDFSYFCGNLTLRSIPGEKDTDKYTLRWTYLQFQALSGHAKNESFVFGDAWHCVGFFTGGILSGLLIVALLLTITFIGVCWMMDINTMDRFDDPKGKTITINASD